MKTFKVDFSKGINLVTDKRLLPEGYLVLADNIDLRSGSIRPFKMPEPFTTFSGGVPSGTTCLWEFKNNWFFSSLYRQYTAEYVSSQSRVYFCETNIGGVYGVNHLIPQKIVNGIQAQLGTVVPQVAPIVTASVADSPSNIDAWRCYLPFSRRPRHLRRSSRSPSRWTSPWNLRRLLRHHPNAGQAGQEKRPSRSPQRRHLQRQPRRHLQRRRLL